MNIAATAITTSNSAARAVPGSQTRANPATATTNQTTNTPSGDGAGGATSETIRRSQDSIELSAKGRRLAQTIAEDVASEEVAKEKTKAPKAEPQDVPDARLEALPGKEPLWETERRAKLERLETLVRQGLYKVDPFMLDEIAVRMAKMLY
jgi:anti-sigma28 factor (negative regulator of flagellin synthesis)